MTVRALLNRLLWHPDEAIADCAVTYTHRGAPGDRVTIPGALIRAVKASWFTYESEAGVTVIPFHRILWIENVKTGRVLWIKRGQKPG
jgi:uncharacterized protein (UPF0248 family)